MGYHVNSTGVLPLRIATQRTPRRSASRLCHRDGDKASGGCAIQLPSRTAHKSAGLLTPEALAAPQRVLCRAAVPSSGCNIFNNNALHGSLLLSFPPLCFFWRGEGGVMRLKMVCLKRSVKPLAKSVPISALICLEARFMGEYGFSFFFFFLQFMGVVWWNPVHPVHQAVCNKQDLC